MTPIQQYNAKRYLLNRLSCEAMIAVDEFRENVCHEYYGFDGMIATHFLARRLMKLARLQAKITGKVLFMTVNSADADSVLP